MKRIVLSTSGVNRYGYRVLTNGIQLENFRKNPVMFFNHSTYGLAIGSWTDIKFENDTLSAIPVFDEITELSKNCKAMYEIGTLSAASIGFKTISSSDDPRLALQGQRYETVTQCELLEVSLVGIPANPAATVVELNFNLSGEVPLLQIKPVNDMDKNLLIQKLGLKPDASDEAILAEIDALKKGKEDALLQLGIDKGVVDAGNEAFYRLAIQQDAASVKLYFDGVQAPEQNAPKPAATTEPVKEVKLLSHQLSAARANAASSVSTDDRSKWTYLDWKEKDLKGLKEMMRTNLLAYDELVRDYYKA
jgi:HK97 family phage prohead protease